MKKKDLAVLGIPKGEPMNLAGPAIKKAMASGMDKVAVAKTIEALAAEPKDFVDDSSFGELARSILAAHAVMASFKHRTEPAPFKQWGEDLEESSIDQMRNACKLPISVLGALMPDAHTGYGLPIGGVLATKNAVIPYAVGMDIACRMKLTVLDMPAAAITESRDRLSRALEKETSFGVSAGFTIRRMHHVLDEDWGVTKITEKLKDRAWKQLGSSGSGNHFVEFGTLTFEKDDMGMKAGTYLAVLSHSGSRGTGAEIATLFSTLAMELHPELPQELKQLAWLDMDSESGQEYWAAMELMGKYAAANHELIHKHIAQHLGVEILLDVENHHNFAWKEKHFGEEVIVHRKGATPAGVGVLGIIPGSMGTAGYLIRGKGNPDSLNSSSHGAGRKMSRAAAMKNFTWEDANNFLAERGVVLLSAGLDEIPMAYKDIESVMAAQSDLVASVAKFEPKIVKMAPSNENRRRR